MSETPQLPAPIDGPFLRAFDAQSAALAPIWADAMTEAFEAGLAHAETWTKKGGIYTQAQLLKALRIENPDVASDLMPEVVKLAAHRDECAGWLFDLGKAMGLPPMQAGGRDALMARAKELAELAAKPKRGSGKAAKAAEAAKPEAQPEAAVERVPCPILPPLGAEVSVAYTVDGAGRIASGVVINHLPCGGLRLTSVVIAGDKLTRWGLSMGNNIPAPRGRMTWPTGLSRLCTVTEVMLYQDGTWKCHPKEVGGQPFQAALNGPNAATWTPEEAEGDKPDAITPAEQAIEAGAEPEYDEEEAQAEEAGIEPEHNTPEPEAPALEDEWGGL